MIKDSSSDHAVFEIKLDIGSNTLYHVIYFGDILEYVKLSKTDVKVSSKDWIRCLAV